MNNKNNLGFTFVEMIIAISIVVLLAVIGNSSINSHKEKSNNSKVVSDLGTLNNSLLSYETENNNLPKSGGNDNFFKEDTSYSHSWTSTGTYGAHGFVTDNTIPKKYLNYLPLDPVTSQYYAYGRTKADMQFEVAGVIFNNGEPVSLVNGDYTAENGPYNLIREYNGPDFVYDKSSNNFPYNPYEKVLIAKINDFSGSVTDIKINNIPYNNTGSLLSYNLKKGDKISVATGSTADIFFSDGTTSTLGDMARNSEVILSDMSFGGENNLITRIKLALGVGTIWSQATSLGTNSEFNIYTTDSSAAVRGTVFGVSKDTNTNVVVLDGNVEVKKIKANITNLKSLDDNLSKNIQVEAPLTSAITNINVGKELTILKTASLPTTAVNSTNANLIPQSTLNSVGRITNAIQVRILKYKAKHLNDINAEIEIEIKLNEILKQKADYLKIVSGDKKYKLNNNNWTREKLTLTGGTIFKTVNTSTDFINIIKPRHNISLSFCKSAVSGERCTKANVIKILEKEFSFEDTNKCPDGQKHFAHECVKTKVNGFKLVAYAPYTSNTNLYKKDGTIITSSSSGITLSGVTIGGVKTIGALISTGSTAGTGTFLAYSGSELGLDGKDFMIEMRVRIPDDTSNHYLIHAGNFKLFTNKGKLIFSTGGVDSTNGQKINLWKFNKIYIKRKNKEIFYKTNNNQYINALNGVKMIFTDNINNIYIGGVKGGVKGGAIYFLQLNDIIDYVKIYKK